MKIGKVNKNKISLKKSRKIIKIKYQNKLENQLNLDYRNNHKKLVNSLLR